MHFETRTVPVAISSSIGRDLFPDEASCPLETKPFAAMGPAAGELTCPLETKPFDEVRAWSDEACPLETKPFSAADATLLASGCPLETKPFSAPAENIVLT